MTQDKIMSLEASTYANLAKHNKVFNKSAIEYHLWIYLDPSDVRDAFFLGAKEIGPHADNSKLFPDTFVREGQCWIRANTEYLDLVAGTHIIKLSFVDRFTDTDFSLFVSYIIQDDNPEKPYVYMKEDEVPEVPLPPGPVVTLTPYVDPNDQ